MLHSVTGKKDAVLMALENAIEAFTDNNQIVQDKMGEEFPDKTTRDKAQAKILSDLKLAYQQAQSSDSDLRWFTPRGPMAGLVQAAMNNTVQEESPRQAAGSTQSHLLSPEALPAIEQFGALDPGWIECLIDGFATLPRGKAPFVQHKNLDDFLYPIGDDVTFALMSDWAADNPAAHLVSNQIRTAKPEIVIHLGDIYYAGQENEALAMLKMWPLADTTTETVPARTSFAVNGNHEMFSGGHAYFQTVLQKFGQPASYFGLRNSYWQILAFDSAYIEHRLLPPAEAAQQDARLESQWNWLVDKMRNSHLPTIFLSHHQPVSAYEQQNNDAKKIRADFDQFTSAAGRPVFGWFFGHEHRCTIYDDANVPYFARLIGNGCIPHEAPPIDQKPEPGCFGFSRMNTRTNGNGDAVSGFALLKFSGRNLDITYKNEDGTVFYEETWVAPLSS